jgi:type VI secretion system protein VasD
MRNFFQLVCWFLLSLSLIGVLGCPPAPTRVSMVISATNNVNPDVGGQSLSVVVRLYQLKDKGRMETADYNAIWKSDKETLSDDLLERTERVVQPGTQEMMEVQPNPSASYLAVVALFRNPSGDTWRKIIPLKKGAAQKFGVTLQDQNVEIRTSTAKN